MPFLHVHRGLTFLAVLTGVGLQAPQVPLVALITTGFDTETVLPSFSMAETYTLASVFLLRNVTAALSSAALNFFASSVLASADTMYSIVMVLICFIVSP